MYNKHKYIQYRYASTCIYAKHIQVQVKPLHHKEQSIGTDLINISIF